jgi:hypothetical protein
MALPALDKTWQYNVNNRITSSGNGGNDKKSVLLAIKNALKAFASNPWTVAGSSNASAAGMDAVDRWASIANMTGVTSAGSPHSWIVFNQVGVGQICWDMVGSNPTDFLNMTVVWSRGSLFTGGTTTNRPTATDSITLLNGGTWLNGQTTSYEHLWHLWHSTDGHSTRIHVRSLGTILAPGCFARFERPKSPLAQWTTPAIIGWNGTASSFLSSTWSSTASLKGNKPGGGEMNLFTTCEGWSSALGPTRLALPNDFTTEYEIFPLALACEEVGARGRHGEQFDLWYVTSSLVDGDTMPADASKQFVVVGDILLPWNNTTMLLS